MNFPKAKQFDNGIETNIYEIARQIFSKPPQEPCTIQLMMSHEIPEEETLTDFEFNLMGEITVTGMRMLFGQNANPVTLSETDFDYLNKYIRSMGYDLKKEIEETDQQIICRVAFDRYSDRDLGQTSELSRMGNMDHLRDRMISRHTVPDSPAPTPVSTPIGNSSDEAIRFIENLLREDPSKKSAVLRHYRKYVKTHPTERDAVINLVKTRFGMDLGEDGLNLQV